PTYWKYGRQLSGSGWQWPVDPPFGLIGQMLTLMLGPGAASGSALQTSAFDVLNEPPRDPLQYLYGDLVLDRRLRELVKAAFGYGVVLNRYAGSTHTMHVGEPPPAFTTDGPPPADYLEAMRQMPLLRDQGDGVKNFVGLILNIVAAPFFYLLIDEPDLYLHPPQAELIGRLIGTLKRPETQVFLATHSADLLRGLISTSSVPTTVLRLDRRSGQSTCSQLAADDVKVLWADPLLRYSSILQGVFHSGAVLCESDSDCRFYSSVLDVVAEGLNTIPDVLFTHCGGKHRLRMAVSALRAVGVPVAVIADFDLLQDRNVLQPLIEIMGGVWSEFEKSWAIVKSGVESLANNPSTSYVRETVLKNLASIGSDRLQPKDEEILKQSFKTESGWAAAKRTGLSGLPAGDSSAAGISLLDRLGTIGIFVVPIGELERFVPQIGNKGPQWISDVHAAGLHVQAATGEAGPFVARVWRYTQAGH
ncbi:MAG TPA: AAA family ATPase, partial [Candidatus Dormibacteraeota bacterium]|nr:AAA family ATPase [Candidatus Dormibacteraeota bacterium]